MLTSLSRAQKRAILLITDAAAVFPALALASILRADADGWSGDLVLLLPVVVTCVLASQLLGVADIRVSAYEERAAGKSLVLSLILGTVLLAFVHASGHALAPAMGVLFAACHFALSITARAAMAQVLKWAYRHGAPRRRVLIYGAGSLGLQALQALRSHPLMKPVGFIDDAPSLRGVMIGGVHVHPPLKLGKLAGRLRAEEVLIARPDLSTADRAALAQRLEASGLRVANLPAFGHLSGTGTQRSSDLEALDRPTPEISVTARQAYCDRVVLVTGAGGSIGSELAHQILSLRPRRLILVELSEYALYRVDAVLRSMAEAAGIPLQVVLGSVGDPVLMRRLLSESRPDIVLHAAAYKHVPLVEENPAAALANNVLGTECLARLAAEFGVERFVLISSDKAVRPTSTMGLSKWIAEHILRDLSRRTPGFQAVVVRFGNVLGSSGSVLPRFQQQVQNGGPVTVTDPRMERYFMSVEEAVHLVLESGAMSESDEVFPV